LLHQQQIVFTTTHPFDKQFAKDCLKGMADRVYTERSKKGDTDADTDDRSSLKSEVIPD
jgi:hypothetical protein